MQLSPKALTAVRRVALGSTIAAVGLIGGAAGAQDATDPASTGSGAPTAEPAAGPTPEPVATTEPAPPTTAVPFDVDDCPGCGMG